MYDEESEELSDDLKNISGEIADLTKTAKTPGGISLFTDDTRQTYKSTYQILKEISEIYNDLSDKNQAQLLEKLGGKRGGQVLAGVLTNFSAAENALKEMENAAGSSDAEMGIIEQSLNYKINALRETWVGTAQAMIDRGDFGTIIDSLTKLSEAIGFLIDKLGLLGTLGIAGGIGKFIKNFSVIRELTSSSVGNAIKTLSSSMAIIDGGTGLLNTASLQAYTTALNGLSLKQAEVALSTTLLTEAQKSQVLVNAGLVLSESSVTTALATEAMEKAGLNAETIALVLSEAGLTTATDTCTTAQIKSALATHASSEAKTEEVLANLGLIASNKATGFSFNALAASVVRATKAIGKFLITNPVGWAIIAGSAILGITKFLSTINVTADESREKLSELQNEFDTAKSEIESLNSELQTTQSRIDELKTKGNLSLTEQEELSNLKKQNSELERTIALKESQQKIEAKELAKQGSKTYEKYTNKQNIFNKNISNRAYDENKIKDYQNNLISSNAQERINVSRNEFNNGNVFATDYINEVLDSLDFKKHENDINYFVAAYRQLQDLQIDIGNNIDRIVKKGSSASEEEIKQAQSLQEYYDSVGDKILKAEVAMSDYSSAIQESYSALKDAEELGVITDAQKQQLAEIESFFLVYDKIMGSASTVENSINNIFAKSKFDGVKDSLISAGKEGSDALYNLISTVPGLADELNSAGVSAQQLHDYIMAIAAPDSLNFIEIKSQLREAFTKDDYEINLKAGENSDKIFDNFLKGKDQEEIEIFYKYIKENNLEISDWTEDDLQYNFKIAIDASIVAKELATITEDTTTALSGINAVNEALASQGTGKSIDLSTFNSEELKAYQSALEYVNGSIQLNADKVRELTKEKVKEQIATNKATKAQLQSDYRKNAGEIEDLREKLSGLDETSVEYTDTLASIQQLQSNNTAIANQCRQIDLLNSSLRESIGIYQKWKEVQNSSESGDMFDETKEMYQLIKDTNDKESELYGKIGNENYQTAVEFLVPDSINREDMDAVNKYINSIKKYLKFDKDGKEVKGLDIGQFISDAVDKGLMYLDEETNSYQIAGERTMEEFASGLGLSLPLVQAIFGEIEEYQPDSQKFKWGEAEQSLGDLAVKAGEASNALKTLDKYKDIKIKMDISDLESDEEKMYALNSTIREMNSIKAKVSVDSSDYEYANQVIAYCVAQRQILTQPVVMTVDTSGMENTDLAEAISLLQQLQQYQNTKQINLEVGADTTQVDENIQNVVEQIKSNPEAMATIGIKIDDSTSATTILQQLREQDIEIYAKVGAKTEEAENSLDEISKVVIDDKEFKIIADANDALKDVKDINTELNKIPNEKNVNINVKKNETGETSDKAKNKKDNKSSETEDSKNGLSSSTGTVSINKTGSSKKVETEKTPETEVNAKIEVPEKIETEKTPETEVKAEVKVSKKVEPEETPKTKVEADVKVPEKVETEKVPETEVKADVKVPEKIKSEKTPETEVKAKVKVPEKVETEKTPEVPIPMASIKNLNNNGWNFESDNEDTLLAVPTSDYKKKNSSDSSYMGVVINPVLPNGEILSPDEIDKYINDIFENKEIDPDVQFTLFEEKDFGSTLDMIYYLKDAFWGLAYRGKKENVLNSLESIRKNGYTSEQLKNIDFNDDKIVDGEKEVNSLLQALDLTKDHASALIQILEQIGFFEIPIEVQDVPEDKVSSEARKVQDELNQNPVKVPVTTETQVPVENQNSTPSTTSVIKVQADTTDANESIQKTKETANETTGFLKIDGDDKPAKTKTDETVKYIDSQTGYIKIEPKTDNLNNNIQNALNEKTFKINVDVNVGNTGGSSGSKTVKKETRANGTPFITSARFNDGYLGHAFANGTVGEPKDIVALTGELEEELVVRGNRFFTVGKNGAEMVHLKKGDIVFNPEQTKQLLSRGYINGRGKALAQGNARNGTSSTVSGGISADMVKKLNSVPSNNSDDATKKNTKEKDKNTKAVKRSTQAFDWIEKRLIHFEKITKSFADTITDYVQLAFKKTQLNKQMDAINKEITANTRGANAYLRKADNVAKNYKYYDDNGKEHSVSVSAQYKKLVQQGKYKKIKYKIEEMDTSKEQKAALAEAIQKYDDYYNKSQECKQAVIDLRNEQLELYEQWANIPTEQAEKKIDSLDLSLKQLERDYAKLGNYNVSAMNKNIDQQTENARKQNNEYQKALKEANANFDNADNNYSNKKTALLKNKKLSDNQKKAIENGNEISTVGIKDKKLLKQVNAYNMALQKKTIATDTQSEALKNATESEKNYYETMQANSQTKFDNIATAYENQIAALEHTGNMMNAYMNRAETMGFIMSKKYYQILQNVEASNLEQLKQEKAALIASLEESVRNGSIVKYSTDWYDMKSKIDDVTESIEESTTAMIEYNNSIRDLDWQIFDLIQERISYVTDEADFLINLMSNSKLYEDNGQLTDKGTATMGLHGLNYNVAMAQADDYAKKIAELDAEIASSQEKANDQNLLKKRQEYIELQRDSILAAEDEKQAIKDMVSEGIEKELDALKELIDKYNEVMDSQKDLYDYQKKIKDQTKEIAKLEKQLAVYKGDKSEEAKATVQKIKVSLEDARENLKESEYDKYVSDQKKLLDDLYSEYEDVLNERLDDLDTLIQDMINQLNDEESTINKTIRGVASNVGVDLSSEMKKIWNGDTTLSSVLKSYGTDFSKLTTISDTLTGIKEDIAKMVINSDKEAEDDINKDVDKSGNSGGGNTGNDKPQTLTAEQQKKIEDTVKSSLGSNSTDSLGKNVENKNGGSLNTLTNGKSDPANTLMAVDSADTLKSKVTALFKTLKSKKLTKKELDKHSSLFKHIYNKTNNRNITDDKILTLGKTLGVKNLPKKAENLTTANKNAILEKLKTVKGYKTGTRSVPKDGYAWTQEDGQEFIIRKKDGGILTPVKREDMIFNKAASKNLYDFANNPPGFINGLSGIGNVDIPASVVNRNITGDSHDNINITLSFPNVQNYEELKYSLQHDPHFEKMLRAMTTDKLFGGSSLKKYK